MVDRVNTHEATHSAIYIVSAVDGLKMKLGGGGWKIAGVITKTQRLRVKFERRDIVLHAKVDSSVFHVLFFRPFPLILIA